MSKLKVLSGKDFAKVIEGLGAEYVRQSGSHAKYRRGKWQTEVPMHGNDTLKRGLVNAMLKQLHISKDEFNNAVGRDE